MNDEELHDGTLTPEDLNRIAAALEGRASALERKQVERLLQQSEAAREVFAEAAVALGLDEEHPEGRERSAQAPVARLFRWRWLFPLAAAAVLAVALWPSDPGTLDEWVTILSAPPAPTPYSLPMMRGSGNGSLSTATRVGVRWLDIRLAAAARNTALVGSLTGMLIEDLRPVPGSAPVIGRLEAFTANLEPVEPVHRGLLDLLGSQVETGMALEALRLATARGNRSLATTILDDDDVYDALERTLEDDPRRVALDVRGPGSGALDLDELNRLTESALSAILRP